MRTPSLGLVLCLSAGLQAAGTDLFQAVRDNDLAALRAMIESRADLEARDRRGATPLMHAAVFGTVDALKILLAGGAEANAKNRVDATALIWAAGDPAKVRLLLKHEADPNAATKQGRTPLIAATSYAGNVETVRLLLDRGANLNAADQSGNTALFQSAWAADDFEITKLLVERGANVNAPGEDGFTTLMMAAANGNLAVVRLLLAHGANPNAANTDSRAKVRHGDIALRALTPLMLAVPHNSRPAIPKLLLDAGAEVNARDVREMTPLMLAVSSETQSPEAVRFLLARGAAVNATSQNGETALDWALKFSNPRVLALLNQAGAKPGVPYEPPPPPTEHPASPRQAVERAAALLQRSNTEFFRQSGCTACHHQNAALMAAAAARAAGIAVDEEAAAETVKQVKGQWTVMQEMLLQRIDGPAPPDLQASALLGLAAERYPADAMTDTIAVNVAATQRADGSWSLKGIARSPMEESDIARTAMALRSLQVYGPPARKADFDARIARARHWLEKAEPAVTDDSVWRLLGLYWSGADRARRDAAAKALLRLQGPDGGWAGNPHLTSDAYATGSALWALHTAGALAPAAPAYQRGVRYLLANQYPDGSWYVRSRAPKFQPYFESGFPFGHDQWISAAATAWAATALAPAVNRAAYTESSR